LHQEVSPPVSHPSPPHMAIYELFPTGALPCQSLWCWHKFCVNTEISLPLATRWSTILCLMSVRWHTGRRVGPWSLWISLLLRKAFRRRRFHLGKWWRLLGGLPIIFFVWHFQGLCLTPPWSFAWQRLTDPCLSRTFFVISILKLSKRGIVRHRQIDNTRQYFNVAKPGLWSTYRRWLRGLVGQKLQEASDMLKANLINMHNNQIVILCNVITLPNMLFFSAVFACTMGAISQCLSMYALWTKFLSTSQVLSAAVAAQNQP
jgi:hypothetical protein